MQQIISIHIGQCGIQMGDALWELLTFEHLLFQDGTLQMDVGLEEANDVLFNVSVTGKHVPRTIFIDLEPTTIDEIKNGSFKRLFHPNQLISGAEDASNNFARGYFTSGRLIKVVFDNQFRKEIEKCENLQAIYLYRSLGGGTGSGMSAIAFEILCEFSKIPKLEIPIHPSPHLSSAIVEPYNCILSEHFCMDDIDICLMMDNEALYDIITNEIAILQPTFHNINRILAQVCSSITSSTRFKNDLYNDFTIMTNLVPYPRIHFPLVSYAPFGNIQKINKDVISATEITKALFWSNNQLVKCDPSIGKFMSCSMLYRGEISVNEIYEALNDLKSGNTVNFVDWCPTGFKIGIVNRPPQIIPDSKIGISSKNVIMLTNNSSVSSVWLRLSQKFHKLYSKRSFIHWFVGEGLEENEFCESLYNIATLAKDYEEVAMDSNYFKEDNSDQTDSLSDIEKDILKSLPQNSSFKKTEFKNKNDTEIGIENENDNIKCTIDNSCEQNIHKTVNTEENEKSTPKVEDKLDEKDEEDSNEKGENNEDNKDEEEDSNQKNEENSPEKDEDSGSSEHNDDKEKKSDEDESIVQENISNILSLHCASKDLLCDSSQIDKNKFLTITNNVKLNNYNIETNNNLKNKKNISILFNRSNFDKDLKGNNYSYKIVEEPKKTLFNPNMYKINFIKKCANTNTCLKFANREERLQSLMNQLNKLIS